MRRPIWPRIQRAATAPPARVLVGAVLGAGLLAGCTDGGQDEPAPTPSTSAGSKATTAAEPATRARLRHVTGRLPRSKRDAVTHDVAAVVDRWFDTAYLGDFPRRDYRPTFALFTGGAAGKARAAASLMTNAGISPRIDGAEATKRAVSLDVLAVRRRAVGVTATVDLLFTTSGRLAATHHVTGRLDLTPERGGWKIFGFDVDRSRSAAAKPAPSASASPSSATEDAS